MMKYQVISHQHIFEPKRYFRQCHASSVALLPDGCTGAAWFGGTQEKADDVAIWFSKRRKGEWTEPEKIADAPEIPCWNPVLFCDGNRTLLFYKVGKEISRWQTMIKESFDGGKSWCAERELVPGDFGGRGPVKNKCIRLMDGSILAPASTEEGEWNCFLDRSEDGGKTFTPAKKTQIPNNNSGIDAVRMEDGRIVLVYNPVSGNWAARSPICFAVSEDGGETFGEPQILDYVPCDKNEERAEFSYPAIVSKGNDVFLTYTWKRETIAFWQIRIF